MNNVQYRLDLILEVIGNDELRASEIHDRAKGQSLYFRSLGVVSIFAYLWQLEDAGDLESRWSDRVVEIQGEYFRSKWYKITQQGRRSRLEKQVAQNFGEGAIA